VKVPTHWIGFLLMQKIDVKQMNRPLQIWVTP